MRDLEEGLKISDLVFSLRSWRGCKHGVCAQCSQRPRAAKTGFVSIDRQVKTSCEVMCKKKSLLMFGKRRMEVVCGTSFRTDKVVT